MKKLILGLVLVTFLGGCSSLGKFIPSKFDNVEYGKLVELNVIAISHGRTQEWCNASILNQMKYRAEWLHTYSKYRLNANITEIYKGLLDLTTELKDRENPSEAYCKIKRTSIHDTTTNVLSVFGSRKS